MCIMRSYSLISPCKQMAGNDITLVVAVVHFNGFLAILAIVRYHCSQVVLVRVPFLAIEMQA